MAYNLIGLSSVTFGIAAETGVVVQNFTSTETAETTELSAHNGVFSAVARGDELLVGVDDIGIGQDGVGGDFLAS